MAKSKVIAASLISSVLATGALTALPAHAEGKMEKCYGVAKAGHNDCATNSSSCAGTSKSDDQSDAFIAVPKGLCDKLTGGSTSSK